MTEVQFVETQEKFEAAEQRAFVKPVHFVMVHLGNYQYYKSFD